MRRVLFLVLCVSASLRLASADAPSSVSAAPTTQAATGLDAMSAYVGTWKSEIHYLDTPYSKQGDSNYELRNDCWRSVGFYACDQFVGGDSKALLVFTYDATRGYTSYPITPDSGDTLHGGRLIIEGKVWTFPWQSVTDGKITYFHVLNIWVSRDSIEFRQEYSTDGKQWVLMASGRETRIIRLNRAGQSALKTVNLDETGTAAG